MGFLFRGLSVAALACAILSSEVSAQTAVEYGEKSLSPYMHQQETFGPLNDGMFGESINLSTGGISFSQTDLSLPGNSALPVALTRRLVVDGNKSPTHANDMDLWKDFAFGEWELDVPYLSGTYSNTEGWTVDTATPNARCTSPTNNAQYAPKPVSLNGAYFYSFSFWGGISLYVPGQGEQSLSTRIAGTPLPQPTVAPQTLLTTQSNWRFNCLTTLKSGQAGEGFVGLSPDGNKYYFDWMVSYRERPLSQMVVGSSPPGGAPPTHHLETMTRSQIRLYVSRIEDRFGNYVDYNWTGAKLTSIVANDSRQITLAYNAAGAVESATNGTQSMGYGYSSGYLSTVTQPDNSAWTFSSAAMRSIDRYVPLTDANFTDFPFECQMMRKLTSEEGVLSMTHPSGAVGQFTLGFKRHYRTNIDGVSSCPFLDEGSPQEADGPQAVDNWWRHKPYVNIRFDVLAVKKKVLSGPGVAPMQWSYGHADTYNLAPYGYPIQGKRTVNVTNPDTTTEVSVYGTDATANEDQLLSQEVRSGQTVASHADLTYVQTAELPSMGFPDRMGTPLVADWTGTSPSIKGANRPLKQKTVLQDGANFNYRVNTFDVFARSLSVDKWSGGMAANYSKTDVTQYLDNLGKWVLGQVEKVTCVAPTSAPPAGCGASGTVISETTYDPTYGLPLTNKSFGKLQQTLTYDTTSTVISGQLGTVKTVKDGNNNVITLSGWKRGTPQSIKYPITTESPTGATQSAVVHDAGWITSVTDENGYKTCYGYDAMGRISQITYPSETTVGVCDASAWTPTSITFAGGNAAAYGMPAGHWRQTTLTGNGRKVLVFDALWRPVVEQTMDLGNVTGTLSEVITRYDVQGQPEFRSYPMNTNGLANYADTTLKGTWTDYDVLDRVTSVSQDSELGLLTTLTEYLTGFKTRITPPKGAAWATTTSYMAYDQPSTNWPVNVVHPAGAVTNISRDVLGKPLTLRRQDAGNTVGISRSYSYTGYQELCRTFEPETGVTLMGYDGAGNLTWSAAGLSPTAAPGCHSTGDQASINPRKAVRTYDARNRVKTLSFADGRGNQTWNYHPDGLAYQIYTYNGAGNTEGVLNTYTYNKRRLLTAETIGQIGWYTWALGYAYNVNGHLSAHASYPDGLAVTYSPNALGQPRAVTDQYGQTYASDVAYYPNGAIKGFKYGNGIVHTMTQNARQLPSRSTDCTLAGTCASANQRLDLGYAFDQHANVSAITDYTAGARQSRAMVYDNLDRLTQTTSAMFGTASYGYDVLDNLKRVTVGASAQQPARDHYYCYDAASYRLTNIRTGSCSGPTVKALEYDVQGNVEQKDAQAYVFDLGNRLREATGKEKYRYDGQGRRVQSQNTAPEYSLWHYASNGQLMYSHDGRNNRQTDYIYLGGSLLAMREAPVGTTTTTVKYQHTDALGTPIATTDSAGAFIEKSEYEPYGQLVNRSLTDGPGFTGHVQDAATGLTYMQQRYYDPQIGRFLSVDPVTANSGTGANFNRYWYAANSPYKFTDPDGRAPCRNDNWNCDRMADPVSRERQHQCEMTCLGKSGRAAGPAGKKLGRPETPNHTNSGPEKPDPNKWRIAATVYDTNSATVDSSGPILIQPGSLAFPAPTLQFYYAVYQRPLGSNGNPENVAAAANWFEPVVHGSGGTGLFDRTAYRFSTEVIGSGGSRWYIEIRNSESTHDNGQDPFLNIYVPIDR